MTLPWFVLLLALAPAPQVALPRGGALVSAAADEVELERLATRLGPARLLRVVAGGSPRQRLVALRALGLSGERHPELAAHALLPLAQWLLSQASEPGERREARLLEVGAEAALRLCRALGQAAELLLAEEAAMDELPRAAAVLLRAAGEGGLPLAPRERLLQAVLALPPHLWPTERLLALAAAGSPLREAALLGLARGGRDPAGERALLPIIDGDSEDRELALAAVLALCERAPAVAPEGRGRPDAVAPAVAPEGRGRPDAGALQPAALRARARALAQAEPLPRGERQRLVPCLRRLGTPADLALAAELAAPALPHAGPHRRGGP